MNPQSAFDVWILPMEGDEASGWRPGKPTIFLNGPFDEREAMFSPDGRWIAYQSNKSGRSEVYVRPYPGPGGEVQISTDGGAFPTWSRTVREIVYGSPTQQIMVADYTVEGNSFLAKKPRLWSDERYRPRGGGPFRSFDLHPDGQRLALQAVEPATAGPKQDHVTVIFNAFEELRRMAPVKKP